MLRLDINLVFTIINLLIWYGIIRIFLFKPVNKVIQKREEAIKARYDQAEEMRTAAESEKKEYQAMQAGIEEEKTKLLTEAKNSAREEYQQIVADAQKEAEKLVEEAKKNAAIEREKSVTRTEQEIRNLLMETTARSLGEKRDKASNQGLYDQFLEKAGDTANG